MRIAHLVDGRTMTGAISSVIRIMSNYKFDDSELLLISYGSPITIERSNNFKTEYFNLEFPKCLSFFVTSPIKHIYLLPWLLVAFFTDILRLKKYCRKNKIECLHLHHFSDIFQYGFLSSSGIRIISHIRAIVNRKMYWGLPYKLFRHYVYRNSSKIIGISRASIDALDLCNDNKTVIVYNGLEGLEKTEHTGISALCDGAFIVGSVIRFAKLKGIDLFFDTFFKYFEMFPNANLKFLLIAPAKNFETQEMRSYYFQKVKDAGLSDKLIYFEHFPDYSYIMPYINILFHTTLHREGFGNVVLEANWFGKPAISTPCQGVNDIISHNKSGFIMSGYTADEACGLINRLAKNSIEYNNFSEQAFKIAHSARFRISETINQLHDIYKNLK